MITYHFYSDSFERFVIGWIRIWYTAAESSRTRNATIDVAAVSHKFKGRYLFRFDDFAIVVVAMVSGLSIVTRERGGDFTKFTRVSLAFFVFVWDFSSCN